MSRHASAHRRRATDLPAAPTAPTDRSLYILVRRAVPGGPVRELRAEDSVWPLDKALDRLARQNGYLAPGEARWELAAVVPLLDQGPAGAWATVDASEIRPGEYLEGLRVLGTAPGGPDDSPGTVLVQMEGRDGPEELRAGDPETVFRPDVPAVGP